MTNQWKRRKRKVLRTVHFEKEKKQKKKSYKNKPPKNCAKVRNKKNNLLYLIMILYRTHQMLEDILLKKKGKSHLTVKIKKINMLKGMIKANLSANLKMFVVLIQPLK